MWEGGTVSCHRPKITPASDAVPQYVKLDGAELGSLAMIPCNTSASLFVFSWASDKTRFCLSEAFALMIQMGAMGLLFLEKFPRNGHIGASVDAASSQSSAPESSMMTSALRMVVRRIREV